VRESAHKTTRHHRPALQSRRAWRLPDDLLETIREPLLVLDAHLRVERANRAFFRAFRLSPANTETRVIYDLGEGQWDIPRLRTLLDEVLRDDVRVNNFEVTHEVPGLGRRTLLLNARRISYGPSGKPRVLLAIEDATRRGSAEDATRRPPDEVEQRIRERTAELEEDNKELDAFVYSVAHDLRAPLRVIDSFSRMLENVRAVSLPEEARRDLRVIRENAQHMGRLLEDLLTFSRYRRQRLDKHPVSPAALARKALTDLGVEREERRAHIVIGDMPACDADPVLLTQVFVNLLSNALKFTRQRDVAEIEVGCLNGRDGRPGPVYFVRDNGVGFNMQYADKLFGVFQRLHRAEEYEGTGVGLAITQRIIHRHGGRIWAEAEVDKGATFYFTLGGNGSDE
jgi:signal transduction histidine kinase